MEQIKTFIKELPYIPSNYDEIHLFHLIKQYHKEYKRIISFYLANKNELKVYYEPNMKNLVELFSQEEEDDVEIIYTNSNKFCEIMKTKHNKICEYIELFMHHYIQILNYYLDNKKYLDDELNRSDIKQLSALIKRGQYITSDEEKYIIDMRLNKEVFTNLGGYANHDDTSIKWYEFNSKKYIKTYATGWCHNTIISEYKEGKYEVKLYCELTITGKADNIRTIYGKFDSKKEVLDEINFLNEKFKNYIWKEVITQIEETDDYNELKLSHRAYFRIKEKLCLDFSDFCDFLNNNIYR